MALNKFFRFPFARSGDKTAVPDAVVPAGDVSYDQGYGPYYQLPKTNPLSKDIERDKMNQVLFDVTTALQEYQTNGIPDWITNAQNGGVAFPYPIGARVRYTDGNTYVSTVAANTNLPNSGTGWIREAGRLINLRVVTASGTYTPTPGTASIVVTGVGGGGAGGGSGTTTASQVSVGAGGAGGGWFRKRLTTGFSGVSMIVGAGGIGAAASVGGAGGTTSFGTYSATGGNGGPFGTQSNNTSTFPMGQASPGIGNVSADISGAGMAGQYGIVAPSGQISGQGGASLMGGGANWVFTNGSGIAASSPGAGGSGACAGPSYGINQAGGAGGAGVILIEEYA